MEVCFEKSVGLSIENSLTISDLSGNQSTCSFFVEVNDAIDPVLDLNNIVIDKRKKHLIAEYRSNCKIIQGK